MEALPVEDKASRQSTLIGITVFLCAFATVFVMGRLYTRYFITKSFGWDDAFIGLACITSWAGESLTISQAKEGLGLPISQVNPANLVPMFKYTQFAILLNGITMCFMKVGIGISLLRLSLSKTLNMAIMVCIVISVLVNLIVFPGMFGQCQPLNKLWNPAVEGTCWPKKVSLVLSYVQTVGNVITDFCFTFGPLFYLAKVKVSRYNRLALRGVFLLGLLATACAIAKATQLPQNTKSKDPTYDLVTLTILVVAEMEAGLFAASLPALKTTFERLLSRVFGVHDGLITSGSRSKGHSYSNSNSRNLGYSRHTTPGSTGFGYDDDLPHGAANYVMGDVAKTRRKHDPEESSVEDDQKHILHSASVKTGSDGHDGDGHSGEWITKTVEYTVSDAHSMQGDVRD